MPIMIVNEDDRRIKDIPMINPDNLEGIGMGESPYASDPVHGTFKFLTEYTDNKIDEIDAIILDPNYSLSHHVILKETDRDSRIFVTEIPEENLDDNPENDVSYDSFEIKINYPLPYPQIIEKVGESFKRIKEENCELEYIKKNGEYLNDFDQDEEIQEKERLQFPIWQGPDYENNDKKMYYISNMTYKQEDVKPLEQTQFITKNSKYRIKIIDKDSRDIEKYVKLISGILEKVVKLFKKENNVYYSDAFYCVPDSYSEEKIKIKDKSFGVIKLDKNSELDELIVKYNNKEKNISAKKPFLVLNSNHSKGNPEEYNNYIISLLVNEGNYNVIYDKSLTKSEFFSYIKKGKSIYFTGHGKMGEKADKFLGFSVEDVIEDDFNTDKLFIDFQEENIMKVKDDYDFVFFNSCGSGLEPGVSEINRIFNPRIHFGWNSYMSIVSDDIYIFSVTLFKECVEKNNINKNLETILDEIKSDFSSNPENPHTTWINSIKILRGKYDFFYKR